MGVPRITPTQLRWFRLRRSGLVDPFPSVERTAEGLLGVQAQLPAAADLAFWNRTAGCTFEELRAARLERRTLVRLWGQRNTLHLYRTADWPFFHTALAERRILGRAKLEKAGLLPDLRRLVKRVVARMEAGRALTHADVRSKKLESLGQDGWVVSYLVFMELVRAGLVCHGEERGSESTFVHREHWVPDLPWGPPPAEEALPELALRYLAAYGPAEPADLAFWCGASSTQAKGWLAAAGEGCAAVTVGGRTLICRRRDLAELAHPAPPAARWPVHLLHRFDPLLLATKDKSWLVDERFRKAVWRPAAHVEPVVLVGGRIVGTWRYDRRARGLRVRVDAFARGLSPAVEKRAAERAGSIAAFLGLPLESFETRTI